MITIKCARCGKRIFKYRKIGKGRVLNCWKDRIMRDYGTTREGDEIKCSCGNLIGIDQGGGIRMKQRSFIYSGVITK